MKIRELQKLIHDSICIYRENPYISGQYIDICTGNIDLVPDNILDIEGVLEPLISDLEKILDELPPISESLEGTRARNRAIQEKHEVYLAEFAPLKARIRDYLISP